MSEIGEKGAEAAKGLPDDESLLDGDPEDAKLVATEEAQQEIANTVNELLGKDYKLTKILKKHMQLENVD